MNFFQELAYVGFSNGLIVMVSIHNTVVSIFLYKARQANVSNILKIIFNFANIFRWISNWVFYMTPAEPSFVLCKAFQWILAVGNIVTRVSLEAFLLWRLRQIDDKNKKDKWAGIILLTLRVAMGIAYFFFLEMKLSYDPEHNLTYCDSVEHDSTPFRAAGIVLEVFTDLYVTFRLFQILRGANRNAAQISSNMGRKSKRTLFTAVLYWNFLRLFVSLIFHILPVFTLYDHSDIVDFTRPYINILLSYVITVDAEIVRVIEGKDGKKKGSSAGTEKSMSRSPLSPRTPRGPPRYDGHLSNDLPKYTESQNSYSNEQINGEKVLVSMKRLSFFEWANVVVGNRLRRNNDDAYDDDDDDDDIEEIIDGSQEAIKGEANLEKGLSQDRRSSNFSGTTTMTETSTLDENLDITVQK